MTDVELLDESDFPLEAYIYDETEAENFEISEISRYLKGKGLFENVKIEDSFLEKYSDDVDRLSKDLAKTRIKNLEKSERDFDIDDSHQDFERKRIKGESTGKNTVLYDGFTMKNVFSRLIPNEKKTDSVLHLVFTDRFFATWKPATKRYHARVSVYGLPSIVSTTGIVDAPARPRGFYELDQIERGDEEVVVRNRLEEYEGDFVYYGDERLSEIMKGYAMQAVFYQVSTGPFCRDKSCRLYNPHLQKNILKAQLSDPEFCEEHQNTLERMQDLS